MEKIRFEDNSKLLNDVQKVLAEGFSPIGTRYEFGVSTPRRIVHMASIQMSCPPSWKMVDSGARIISPDEKNFFVFGGHVTIRTANIRAVLSDENAGLLFPALEKNDWLVFDSAVRKLGEVYNLSPTDYAFSLHEHAGIVKEWMVSQVEQNPSIDSLQLALKFRDECSIPRVDSPDGRTSSDFEILWAGKEIGRLVREGILEVAVEKGHGYQHKYLRIPNMEVAVWRRVRRIRRCSRPPLPVRVFYQRMAHQARRWSYLR